MLPPFCHEEKHSHLNSPDPGKLITEGSSPKISAVYDYATKDEKYISDIGEYCTWSPDGKRLAFHWPDSKGFCIYTVNAR